MPQDCDFLLQLLPLERLIKDWLELSQRRFFRFLMLACDRHMVYCAYPTHLAGLNNLFPFWNYEGLLGLNLFLAYQSVVLFVVKFQDCKWSTACALRVEANCLENAVLVDLRLRVRVEDP